MERIELASLGILPGNDITEALYRVFTEHPENTEFVFEPGDYDFTPRFSYDYRLSNTDVFPERRLGIWMRGMKHVRISGRGAHFFFAGQMQAVTMDHCEDVIFEDCVIDWKKPLVAEGTITDFTEHTVDIRVDPAVFPHRYENGMLFFDTGSGEWYPLQYGTHIQFDRNTMNVRRNTGDNFCPDRIEDLGNDTYRFHSPNPVNAAIGNIYVLRHNTRRHAGVFMEKCKNITLDSVTIHSTGGLGCLAQFSTDLTFRRVAFLPNRAAGRFISNGRDDGIHITCCSGTVTVTECEFAGLMDDPINVHSCCCPVIARRSDREIELRYAHEQARNFLYWAEPGDRIALIDRTIMQPVQNLIAEKFTPETPYTFSLVFRDPIPDDIAALLNDPERIAADNLTHTAAFECTYNRFGSCRARGILVSTPRRVRIHGNLFSSSSAGILLAGDSNFWFESGACRDVEISDNVFTDMCCSSEAQFGLGLISINPVVPDPDPEQPYHTHIRILRNRFDSPDMEVLYAYSCGDLTFADNIVTFSPAADATYPERELIHLKACSDTGLHGNRKIGPFTLRDIGTENCVRISGHAFE